MTSQTPQTTRAAVITEYEEPLEVRELPLPEPEAGALVVEMAAATICGTDVHLWEGGLDALGVELPVVPGHEGVGRIIAIGPGADRDSLGASLRIGDRVIWTHGSCGHCHACTVLGQPTLCPNRKVGMYNDCGEFPHVGGTFAEHSYVWPEAGRVKVPGEVRDEWAAAASCALRSAIGVVESAGPILPTDTVLVQGAGPLGLFATALASLQTPRRLIVVGGPPERLELASAWGASATIDIGEHADPAARLARLRELCDGELADVVIEVAGVPAAFAETIEMAAPGGRIVVAGIVDPRRPDVPVSLITLRQLRLRGSFGGHTDSYWKALEFMRLHHERFDFDRLISGSFDLSEATTALRRMQAQEEIKPVLRP
jgi:threonine dehydrogenase-like Zn-dependent dehydrogenase